MLSWRMNDRAAPIVVVLPDAVSPQKKMLMPSSRHIHMYAASCALTVFQLISWVMLIGSAANFLIEKLGPRTLTSSA